MGEIWLNRSVRRNDPWRVPHLHPGPSDWGHGALR